MVVLFKLFVGFVFQSVANGMVFAFLTTLLRRQVILTDGQPCNLFTKRLTILSFVFSLGGITVSGGHNEM